ncbi:MAG TPA: CoA ester lyase [Dehalococcoidia bacterium]|nr:CoA ester lyase [Dehalococcoidia bacterium]
MKPLRSLLYVPGHRRDLIEKAPRFGADGLILDLEDAVPASEKETARRTVAAAIPELVELGVSPVVRVNDLSTGLTPDDIAGVTVAGLAAIRIPKVESPDDVREVDRLLSAAETAAGLTAGGIELMPAIETAVGYHVAHEVATASARITVLSGSALRGGDTQRSIGYRWTPEGLERLYLRSKFLLDCRAARIRSILMTSWSEITDLDGLRRDAAFNRQLGYTGMVVIHPSHVPVVNEVFTPDETELAYWRGLLAAMEQADRQGLAAVTYEGEMVDIAMVKTAREMLSLAGSA